MEIYTVPEDCPLLGGVDIHDTDIKEVFYCLRLLKVKGYQYRSIGITMVAHLLREYGYDERTVFGGRKPEFAEAAIELDKVIESINLHFACLDPLVYDTPIGWLIK